MLKTVTDGDVGGVAKWLPIVPKSEAPGTGSLRSHCCLELQTTKYIGSPHSRRFSVWAFDYYLCVCYMQMLGHVCSPRPEEGIDISFFTLSLWGTVSLSNSNSGYSHRLAASKLQQSSCLYPHTVLVCVRPALPYVLESPCWLSTLTTEPPFLAPTYTAGLVFCFLLFFFVLF